MDAFSILHYSSWFSPEWAIQEKWTKSVIRLRPSFRSHIIHHNLLVTQAKLWHYQEDWHTESRRECWKTQSMLWLIFNVPTLFKIFYGPKDSFYNYISSNSRISSFTSNSHINKALCVYFLEFASSCTISLTIKDTKNCEKNIWFSDTSICRDTHGISTLDSTFKLELSRSHWSIAIPI